MHTQPPPRPRATLHVEIERTVHLAVQQLGRPIVRSLRVENHGPGWIAAAVVRVTVDPAVARDAALPLSPLAPGASQVVDVERLGMPLLVEPLLALAERAHGSVRVSLEGDCECEAVVRPLDVLPADHWPGQALPVDLLAAFVTPNAPGTATLLGHVRAVLARDGRDTSLEGYQRRSRERILELCAGAFGAIGHAKITYANPPAAFGGAGQRVRTVDRLLSEGVGTCLDISLAVCATLEQIGVGALAVVIDGHAFLGAWLVEASLPATWTDEPTLLRNRVRLGELVVFDSSMAAEGARFADAVSAASRMLDERPFVFAVDVTSARKAGVYPLPYRDVDGRAVSVGRGAGSAGSGDAALPALPDLASAHPRAAGGSQPDRLQDFKSRLLDLSLNNRLLHQRSRRSMLQVSCDDVGAVGDVVCRDGDVVLASRGASATAGDPRAAAREALGRRVVTIDLPEGEFQARATDLFRTVRTVTEDTGGAPLFLTLGALRWVESPTAKVDRLAPVVLVPVTLSRDSVRGPFRVRWTGEDPVFNPALRKMLEAEFGVVLAGVERLEIDDGGVDVAGALTRLRAAVRDIPGCEVRPIATIDLLGFAKFTMWADLEQNAEALRSSPILRRLLDPTSPALAQPAPFAEPRTLDEARAARDDLSVVDADSTQLGAMWSALDGNSFVLQGPPGTGKSQTITNLIAQALARHQTVLFVAAKKAALDVVHSRLQAVGLGPFVLEVHSDKATRASVIEQLRASVDAAGESQRSDWAAIADQHAALRARLNAYARRVNQPGPWGETLQQAIGRLSELDTTLQGIPEVELDAAAADDAESVAAMRVALAEMAAEARDLGELAHHPWRAFDPLAHGPLALRDIANAARSLAERHAALSDALLRLNLGFDVLAAPAAPMLRLCALLAEAPPVSAALLAGRRADHAGALADLLTLLDQRRAASAAALSVLNPTVFDEAEWPRWADAIRGWANALALLRFVMLFRVLREVARHAPRPLPAAPALLPVVDGVDVVRATDAEISSLAPSLAPLLGGLWRASETDPAGVRAALGFAEAYQEVRSALGLPATVLDPLVLAARERLAEEPPARRDLEAALDAARAWQVALEAFSGLARPRAADWLSAGGLAAQRGQIEALAASARSVKDWAQYRAAARRVAEGGAASVVAAAERGALPPAAFAGVWERALRRRWVEREISADDMLVAFRGSRHADLVAQFAELDRQAQREARREVVARLRERVPDPTAPGQMEVLRGELARKKSPVAVRSLFGSVRDVLLRLKPCVLMSPMTVAQCLDPALPKFDLVIFDEASQIPPWDAVGALARGERAVVVGDSRQLPPTSFFGKEGGEDADDEELVDTESILDQCLVAGLPEIALGWHYRSRHETLIAFSNQRYYQGRLQVFPSPVGWGGPLGVRFVHVPGGHYERGGSRTNRAEAEALVGELRARVLDPARRAQSVGVVTFSRAQQRCIMDLLDQARRGDAALDQAIQQAPEPLFVKNLESVQGDERDVMLFSVGYGPDATGRVSMGFGPLNRSGGERRLNVAVTRARQQLVVFSTLTPEQMNVAATAAKGVHDLKRFLEYAIHGPAALGGEPPLGPSAVHGSPFEDEVARALQGLGWETRRRVGVADYRVDLAVVHPEHPGRFLMAVVCDGASYHAAATARDRDRLRQSVLEGLGWRVARLWSLDWFHGRRASVLDALVARLNAARREPVGGEPAIVDPAPPAASAPPPGPASRSASARRRRGCG